jgi:drug/metabolite transporter (DMT)-like permease
MIGTIALVTTFIAFALLPMAETTVLLFTATLIVPALAFFILGEKVGLHRWSAIVVGFLGVLAIVGLNGFTGSWLGIGFAIAASLMHASLGLLLRFMKTESPITVTFYFVLTGMVLTGMAMPFIATVPSAFNLFLLVCTGIAGGLAQFCLTAAIKYAPIAVTAPLSYTGLIWATGFDIIIWSVVPGWPVYAGAFVVIAANLYVIYREHKKNIKSHIEP